MVPGLEIKPKAIKRCLKAGKIVDALDFHQKNLKKVFFDGAWA